MPGTVGQAGGFDEFESFLQECSELLWVGQGKLV